MKPAAFETDDIRALIDRRITELLRSPEGSLEEIRRLQAARDALGPGSEPERPGAFDEWLLGDSPEKI